MREELKMIGINASRIFTTMMDIAALWNWTNQLLVAKSMGQTGLPINKDPSAWVTFGVSVSAKFPAFTRFMSTLPESLKSSFPSCHRTYQNVW